MTTATLVEKLEEKFEVLPLQNEEYEPKTLAEAVSNSLMPILPRISPELFEIRRKVNVTLSDKQFGKIDEIYISGHPYENFLTFHTWNGVDGSEKADIIRKALRKKRNLTGEKRAIAKIPFFVFSPIPGESVLTYKDSVKIQYHRKFKFPVGFVNGEGYYDKERYPYEKKVSKLGDSVLDIKEVWTAPLKLHANVIVPELPKEFVELGDEAIATYYDHIRELPKKLRRETSLSPPNLGVLWIPTPKSIYVTGEIPNVNPPIPKGDPILVLDIQSKERNYRHAVAAWDIDEEEPFRDWLSESTGNKPSYILGRKN